MKLKNIWGKDTVNPENHFIEDKSVPDKFVKLNKHLESNELKKKS